jgi:hypothetical protein
MAIRLASAIGEQRKPIDVFGGIDDVINKTSDDIQAANREKRNEEAKKRDAALQAAMSIDTDIDALPEDNKRFKQDATPLVGEVFKLFASGASSAAVNAKAKEVESKLLPLKRRYESDKADWLKIMEDKAKNADKKDYSEAEAYLTGIEKKEMPMSQPISKSQQEGGYGVPTEEEMLGGIEVVDVRERPEYWNASAEEREKIAPAGPYAEVLKRAKDITGNFDDAIDAYTGGKFDPQSRFTNLQDVLNAGGLDKQQVIIDRDAIAKEKSAFISSFGSDLGGVKAKQYWNTLTTLAAKRGREAGLEGDSLKQFVELTVKDVAGKDFDRRVQQDIEKTKIKKIDKDPDKKGQGMNITFMGNGKYQTKTGFYQVDKGKIDTETREQRFRNFKERNLPTILKKTEEDYKAQGKKKAKTAAEDYWNSQEGNEELKRRFDQSYPDTNKKVTRVYPALTPKQDGSNPEVNVVDSRGRTIAFTPSFYNIDEETNKVISVYGVEVVREKGDDGTMKTVQKPTTVPYNTKNKVINNVAPELAEVYKTETGKDIDLEVDESTPSKVAAPSKGAAPKKVTKQEVKNKLAGF